MLTAIDPVRDPFDTAILGEIPERWDYLSADYADYFFWCDEAIFCL